MISAVVPVFNEKDNVGPLVDRLLATLDPLHDEIVLVDDGSTDGSSELMDEVAQQFPCVRVIHLSRNFGQTAAFVAGFDAAKGHLVVSLDADLQNDPQDIPLLVSKLKEGYDVVCGWRRDRHDSWLSRVVISRFANWIIRKATGIPVHDVGCSLRVYKGSVVKKMRLFGDMHRFIPVYCFWAGARMTEIEVTHHPRHKGKSKYGLERILKVILDLLYLRFMMAYMTRPMDFFGKLGFMSIFLGTVVTGWVAFRSIVLGGDWISPLILVGFFLFGLGIIVILIGLLSEMLVRIFFEVAHHKPYSLKEAND